MDLGVMAMKEQSSSRCILQLQPTGLTILNKITLQLYNINGSNRIRIIS